MKSFSNSFMLALIASLIGLSQLAVMVDAQFEDVTTTPETNLVIDAPQDYPPSGRSVNGIWKKYNLSYEIFYYTELLYVEGGGSTSIHVF